MDARAWELIRPYDLQIDLGQLDEILKVILYFNFASMVLNYIILLYSLIIIMSLRKAKLLLEQKKLQEKLADEVNK